MKVITPQFGPPVKENTFLNQIKFWGLHCSLTAMPSFCIAMLQYNDITSILAMICGVLTFIFGYAAITSAPFYKQHHAGIIGRSLRLGTKIRMQISAWSTILVFPILFFGEKAAAAIFVTPDFWFGWAAVISISFVFSPGKFGGILGTDTAGNEFLLPYLITIVEGILISVSLAFIAFIILLSLNSKQKNRIATPPH
ncbi:MAG: hypothetical protein ACPG32_02270 [Akkermansiaceae bacterium]